MATTTSEACKTSELLLQQSNTASNTCAILNSNTDFNCTNCDIKFDSESSLRVHLQYHGESFLGQSTSAGSPWLSSSTTNTSLPSVLPTSSSFTDTGLSPPPSSNNSNVDETQVHTQLKPLHINNNIPTIHPNTSASAGGVLTNTPTPPSSAEAISPSSVSSAATMISYEALPSAIGPSHHHHQLQHQQQHQQQQSQSMTPQQHQLHMGQQAAGMLHPATMQSMHQMQQQYPPQQPQQPQQQQSQQQQQQQPTQPPHAQQGNSENSNLEYELDASSSAEEIWDLDSNTVKRYNNASGDTSASSTGHGSMESPMGSYGSDLGHPGTGAAASTHHYVPTNAMWGAGSAPPMYPQHHPQQHGFPSTAASHDLYASNDWLHAGSGSLKRPSSTQSDDAKRIKTYQCEACDKWFTSSGHLKRHFNTTLHKNATRHQHKSGSPRIGTPASMMGDLSDSQQGPGSNSISNLNTTTSTLNSSPSPSSPVIGPGGPLGGPPGVPSSNNNVPNSPRASFYSSRTSPAMSNPSPVKMPAAVTGPGGMLTGAVAGTGLPNSNQLRPLPSMKESLSHINNSNSEMDPTQKPDWSMQAAVIQRGGGVGAGGFSNLYSPDSVSAVNRSSYSTDTSSSISMTASVASDYSSNDLYNLQPPQNFSYHGHYNTASMEYSHTNGGGGGGGNNTNLYMMYNQGMQPQQPPQPQQQQRVYHHTSDMSNYAPHSEAGSVKDELDQLSVATEDLDEGLSGTGTPATPTDSLEGPPTPVRVSGNGSSTVSNPQAGPTGEYRCSECNKVFNRLCYLKQHNKSFHNGEKPFKCGQCGKRFPVEVLYQEHLAKHAGDKPYKCEVCPKQFNHKTDLRRHMCLHTGEKPFACEVCGKGFIREDRMVKHSDTHKKKQPILMT